MKRIILLIAVLLLFCTSVYADKIALLKSEITTDPLARGYSVMTNEQIATDMNTIYRTSNKALMTATEVLNAISKTEFDALTVADQTKIWNVLHIGNVNPFGIEADIFVNVFGAGSATITNLKAARKNNITRGQELGIGKITVGNVIQAKLP